MDAQLPYIAVTDDVEVGVKPLFLDDQSEPDDGHYVWAYQIRIRNLGNGKVQLRKRHWEITDAKGQIEIVDGDGVVGEQPLIQPGESFEYTSGAPLKTPSGFMAGYYEMEDHRGRNFKVNVPTFSLDSPYVQVVMH